MFAVSLIILTALLAASAAPTQPASQPKDHEYRQLDLPSGGALRYAIVTPPDLDPTKPHPVLLALPPGNQDERMVEAGLAQYWEDEALARGWIVVSPVEPRTQSLFHDTRDTIGPLLDHIASEYSVEGGRFHVGGASNGGRLAFRIATLMPERIASLVVLPGFPPQRVDMERLDALSGKTVTMYVGEDDSQWVEESKRTHQRLVHLGAKATLHVLPDQDHVLHMDADALFDALDAARIRQSPREAEVSQTLDALHAAAAAADFDRYFALFTGDAVFLGTDADERWTVEQFKLYARPHFERGEGWSYTAVDRHISFSESGDVAWFDEMLENAKLGTCRGSGVLVQRDGDWKISQYNLSIPVPNEVADRVVRIIKAHEARD